MHRNFPRGTPPPASWYKRSVTYLNDHDMGKSDVIAFCKNPWTHLVLGFYFVFGLLMYFFPPFPYIFG